MFDFYLPKDLKSKKIKTFSKEYIEPQEVLLDFLAKKKEEELGISEKKFEVLLAKNVLIGMFFLIFLFMALLFVRAFQLQIIEGKELSQLAERNKFTVYKIMAERGVIYDQKGNQLVFNIPSFDLILKKSNLPKDKREKEKVLKEVSWILKKNFEEFKKQIEGEKNEEILIAEDLSHEMLVVFEARIKDLLGFEIKNTSKREYKEKNLFSHILGYLGKINNDELTTEPDFYTIFDDVGRTGLEKTYEPILRRNPGELRIEKDARGKIISQELVTLPESGKSLVLWLDSDLQRKMKEALEQQLKVAQTKKAVAIAMDPKSGGILGMVSLPDYDNNIFQKNSDPDQLKKILEDPEKPLLNRAISGQYLTGSTIKPLIASAALEEKIISPDKKINDDKGYIVIPNPWNPDFPTFKKDWAVHGLTDMRKAIAESCNVYFYTIGGGYENQVGLGVDKIKKYLDLFGWTKKTGIDLPSELSGFVPEKNWKKEKYKQAWTDGDTFNLAIGQGFIKITPIEVVTAFSAIANGGKLLQPKMVKKIIDKDKNTIEEFQPTVIRENFIDPKNLEIVKEGMRQAVTGIGAPQASSVLLNSLPVAAAAKTGTAELGGGYYNIWVTVFAPYDDPQIVLTVMFEKAKGLSVIALPVAKEILEWYFSNNKQ